jgi:uracil phosphoribosyltransferase
LISTGSLKIEQTGDYRGGQQVWHIESVELPPNIAELKVFLFISTCSTGVSVCKAIEVRCIRGARPLAQRSLTLHLFVVLTQILRDAGVKERDISIVMIWCAADGLAVVCNRFPRTSTNLSVLMSVVSFGLIASLLVLQTSG